MAGTVNSIQLYVLLTQAHCRVSILEAAAQVIRGGADAVQMREKECSDGELLRLGRALRRMTAGAGVTFIVNDRPDIARILESDGLHLGQDDLPVAAARRVLGPGRIIGVSTHSIAQARQAVRDGAGYIGVGPVFPTATKGYDAGVGLEYVRVAAAEVRLPLVAIGGITVERVPSVLAAGGPSRTAIAVCSAILGAPDITAATAAFKRAITAAQT